MPGEPKIAPRVDVVKFFDHPAPCQCRRRTGGQYAAPVWMTVQRLHERLYVLPLSGCASAAFAELAVNSTPVMRRSIHRRRRVQVDHRNAKRPQLRCRRRRRGVSGAMGGIFAANADGAVLLALLIGLQNLPEGFIVVFGKSAAKYQNGGFEVNIPVKDEVKCLGYRWMGNLSSSSAIQERIQKSRRAFFEFGSVFAFQGNLSPLSSSSIYQHCVLPI